MQSDRVEDSHDEAKYLIFIIGVRTLSYAYYNFIFNKIRDFDRQDIGGSTFAGENDNEDFGYLADL
ncbi:hypothetical protein HanIR_Chr09g0416381 [Helianthus annuus]|nr:hypothetical protein HanIR_Chr09g0416381 [Helianthus annuus]